MSTKRVAFGSNESVPVAPTAPEFCAAPPPSGRSWTRPTAKSPRSGSCRKFLLTRSKRVRQASIIQRARTTPALKVKTASDQECTVPKASVVVTTARQSMRMMKRLQTVRGNSAVAARGEAGGAGGGAGLGGSVAAVEMSARCCCASAGALEVEIVIPDFSENRAGLFGTARAHEAHDDGLGLRGGHELDRRLLPVVRPRRDGRGLSERGRLRGRVPDDYRERRGAPQVVRADEVGQAVARRRLDGDHLPDVAEINLARRVEEEAQRASATVRRARVQRDLRARRGSHLPLEKLTPRLPDVQLEAPVRDRFGRDPLPARLAEHLERAVVLPVVVECAR